MSEGSHRALILATDLDGTFAHGSDEARAELVGLLRAAPAARLIYVTGRAPAHARALLERMALPDPDVLIADVGTSVLRGIGPARVAEIEAELERTWPGADVVRDRLDSIDALAPQNVDAARRVSYWIEEVRQRSAPAADGDDPFAARAPDDAALAADAARIAAEAAHQARRAVADLDVDVLVSANIFLDVLPRGVNKGSTLRRVLDWMDGAEAECVVAGDSLNDLALFQTGLRGIVVGNCEPALAERVAGMEQVYRARGIGAAGVLEGLRHHGHFRTEGGEQDGE